MKKLISLFLVFITLFPVFAGWEIGQFVDEFDDPTGQEFMYVITDGTFSNSATSNSDAPTRITAEILYWETPRLRFEFEVHDYSFSNPVNEYYDDTTSTMKFKLDSGKIITATNENGMFSSWNVLNPVNNLEVVAELRAGRDVRGIIYVENSTYRFTIPAEGFNDTLTDLYNRMEPEFKVWREKATNSLNSQLDILLAAILGEEYNADPIEYEYYAVEELGDKKCILHYSLSNYNYSKDGTISFSVYPYIVSSIEEPDFYNESPSVTSVNLSNSVGSIVIQEESDEYDANDYKTLKSVMAGGEVSVTINTETGTIETSIDGSVVLPILDTLEV